MAGISGMVLKMRREWTNSSVFIVLLMQSMEIPSGELRLNIRPLVYYIGIFCPNCNDNVPLAPYTVILVSTLHNYFQYLSWVPFKISIWTDTGGRHLSYRSGMCISLIKNVGICSKLLPLVNAQANCILEVGFLQSRL